MAGFEKFVTREGTVTEEKIIEFNDPSARVVIMNDSVDKDLLFKFKQARPFATLKAGEKFDFDFEARQIIIDGDDCDYRIWALM